MFLILVIFKKHEVRSRFSSFKKIGSAFRVLVNVVFHPQTKGMSSASEAEDLTNTTRAMLKLEKC